MSRRAALRDLPVVAGILLASVGAASGSVTFFSSPSAFAAASATALQANFQALPGGAAASPVVQGTVTFTSTLGAQPFYVLTPGNPGDVCCTFPHVTSAALCGNGNEDFAMTFAGPAPTAVGFDYISNNTGITVTVFDGGNLAMGSTTITQHNVGGFLGITSTAPIGRVTFFSQNLAPPNAQNSAIDNVVVGDASTTATEPAAWGRVKSAYR